MPKKSYSELAESLRSAQQIIPIKSWYAHYKGQKYRVESLATLVDDDRDLQTMVIYRPEGHPESVFKRNIAVGRDGNTGRHYKQKIHKAGLNIDTYLLCNIKLLTGFC